LLPERRPEQPPTDGFVVNGVRRADPGYCFSATSRSLAAGASAPGARGPYATSQHESREHGLTGPLVPIKEPNDSFAAELLMSLLPRSRMPCCCDGRDVIGSLLGARTAAGWINPGNVNLSDPAQRLAYVRRQARLWLNCTAPVESAYATHPEKLLRRMVRYRGTARPPVRVAAPACRWARAERKRRWLRESIEAHVFERHRSWDAFVLPWRAEQFGLTRL
jgi:hypothetical protein